MKKTIKNRIKRLKKKLNNKKDAIIFVNKTNLNIYIQIFYFKKKNVIISYSSLNKTIKKILKKKCKEKKNNIFTSYIIGKGFAFKIIKSKLFFNRIHFSRSGYKYHGKVKKFFNTFEKFLKI
ncbi:50S ribosomal protein L18 [Candidatus Vidania fulgoroideorum]